MAQDTRPYKSKEQDGQGNEIILRDQQLVEQGNATTMPSGACFETLDVDNRPVKIPRDNMMNIVLECIGIILNDSSKNLGTNVQKALGLQGNTIGHSTVADFASVLGVAEKASYIRAVSGSNLYYSVDEHVYLTMVLDSDNIENYIVFLTYRPGGKVEHTNYILSSNTLSLGNKNTSGTQVVIGATNPIWHVIVF